MKTKIAIATSALLIVTSSMAYAYDPIGEKVNGDVALNCEYGKHVEFNIAEQKLYSSCGAPTTSTIPEKIYTPATVTETEHTPYMGEVTPNYVEPSFFSEIGTVSTPINANVVSDTATVVTETTTATVTSVTVNTLMAQIMALLTQLMALIAKLNG